jgi:CO/xanthine dehydrogenase Mo-binding subunit/aerobic-type carbon monoxide dehydrogenase small subunit (CoxS/CutS family)
MTEKIEIMVNGQSRQVEVDPVTPLLFVLRNELDLKGAKHGCGQELCGACHVLIDGAAVPSCKLEVGAVKGLEITTIEGLGTPDNLHPLQEAFIEEQAIQCGYCTPGMIIAAQGLLNRHRYPSQEQINQALKTNLCRCGTHERIRRAIKLRVARPEKDALVDVRNVETPAPEDNVLPKGVVDYPELDSWIAINPDETITVFSGKVEYGQGIKTALAQIAAEELDVALGRIKMVMGDTEKTPDEGMTVGSMSLQTSGNNIRQAAAEARHFLRQLALEELEAWPENIQILDGTLSDSNTGRETSYWALLAGKKFNAQIKGIATPKSAHDYGLVGKSAKRIDLLAKVTGTHGYVHDLTWENMLHARVVRPPAYGARLVAVDPLPVEAMADVVKVVRDGSFLGVIAESEFEAVRAMEKLSELAVWEGSPMSSDPEALFRELEAQVDVSYLVVDGSVSEEAIPAAKEPTGASKTLEAVFTKPYHMHATIGPSAAVALMTDKNLTIWGHSQGAFSPRDNIARVLKMPPDKIHYIHTEGSGCYGHNGADDAALDAALLARALPGQPILLKWTRANEHQWEPYNPAAVVKMQASLNPQGEIMDWNHEVYSPPHMGRSRPSDETSGLLAAWHLAEPMPMHPREPSLWNNGGSHRNADPLYTFENKRIVKHAQLNPALRVSSFRGLGAFANVFAIETFMDELAHAAGIDPVEFRLRHLEDPRAVDVIEAATEKANWGASLPENWGRGFAFARYKNSAAYCALVVEARVNPKAPTIELKRVTIVGEAGQVVNPDGLSNQLEGGFIQAASMALKEQVRYGPEGILSKDWDTYPIAVFSELPAIKTLILNRPGMPFLGGGEASIGPAPAAIANAVFSASGIRLRDIPFYSHWPESIKKRQ